MRDDEFAVWLPQMRRDYADDIFDNGGASQEDAQNKALADTERLFPNDEPSPEQFVFVIEANGDAVGDLWLAELDTSQGRSLWIYDIRVDEACRGRGYGKQAMLFAEEEARRRGLGRVALNVFGGNEVARKLYRSLGYIENAVVMSKRLDA